MQTQIAFLGTGLMGAPMVRKLLDHNFEVHVWNRTLSKAKALVGQGAVLAASPQNAIEDADVVISMLSDGVATGTLVESSTPKKRSLWIDMSSTKPSEARAQYKYLANIGVAHLDAPVSGGVKGAENGSLAIMVGGDPVPFDSANAILTAMGRAVHVGPAGAGQLAKLSNQAIVAVTIGAVAEAMMFLQENGADPNAVRQALKGGFADSIILQMHGQRMTEGNFVPGGLSKLQLKDLVNVMEEATGAGLTLPLVQNVFERFNRLCNEMDGGDLDHSAIFLELAERNKLKGI
ncbi:NAD(P)-dependent oxidoreductase [Pseudopelagicola sp. nBUS_19]|uniref:NAD(P)-dependent oxidoreductase n=1 Tax=Pseudopelagicola sp. nBUS_19 TaxID=3395316 RepID=UPI003EB91050